MNVLVIVLRLIHAVSGIVWVGFAVFATFYLAPVVEAAGPEGGKIMAALQRRGLLTVMPLLALATLISGFWLFARDSATAAGTFGRWPMGMTLGIGGLLALIAFLVGIVVMRPAMTRVGRIMASMGEAGTDQERQSRLAEAGRLRARSGAAGRLVTGLLVLTAVARAVALYV